MLLVDNELELLSSLVPLEGARVGELGCGAGDFARRLVSEVRADSVDAFEVDVIQHRKNLEAPAMTGVAFRAGGAEKILLPNQSRDLVIMMKSLHHVPVAKMGQALSEARRVLVAAGMLYVSEPVYAGPFNDIVRIFHDEGETRQAAQAAVRSALDDGLFALAAEVEFLSPIGFRDFEDFDRRMIQVTHTSRAERRTTRAGSVDVRAQHDGRGRALRKADARSSSALQPPDIMQRTLRLRGPIAHLKWNSAYGCVMRPCCLTPSTRPADS